MEVPFFSSVREYHNRKAEFDAAMSAVLEKGDFILGGAVRELEEGIAGYTGARYTVGCGNGSDALVLAGEAAGFRDGAEVITPVFTFFASASCISRLGGRPVFCDVDEDTFCMDMDKAASLVTARTKGLLPVHLFSQMADMDAALRIAGDNGLSVVEDAAEAFGMRQRIGGRDRIAGTVGQSGAYSFFPTKTLGGYGDGGMVITDSEEVYEKVRSLRVHGATKKYHHDYIGYNSRLDSLQAAVLNVKLRHIDESIALRKKFAGQYRELLSGVPQIRLPLVKDGNTPVWYVFQIKAENRDGLSAYLKEEGIGTCVYYPVPLHLQKCFAYLGYREGDFPVAEELCKEVLALPIYPEITEDEVSYVCEKIREFYRK